MEQTIHALAGILLKAVPTVVLVILLHLYLKGMLFKPLEKVLRQRDEATGGARKAAEASFALAEQKAADYERAIRDARSEVYKDHEQARIKLASDQDARLREARQQMDQMVREAKARIEAEAAAASRSLEADTSALADQIASRVLTGKVA